MDEATRYQTLFAYHFDTTRRLLDTAAKLDGDTYNAAPGEDRRSVHALLFHLLNTNRGWRHGLETGQQAPPLEPEDFPDLPTLRAAYEAERQAWQALLVGMSAEQIAAEAELTTLRGYTATFARWQVLQHLVLHGMQHHTEIAQRLSDAGHSPGDIDFIFYR